MVIPIVVCGSQGCIAGMVISDGDFHKGTKVCRYNWHSAGSLGWPFPMLKYEYIFPTKHTEAILSNSSRKLLGCEITKMLIAVLENKFIVIIIIIDIFRVA